MGIEFKINDFEGPLDLLLHLIKESKMDIMNIEIEEITRQYMEYLALQEKMNLEIASEYLVLASELLEIKSKLLLPSHTLEDEEEVVDTKEELINRLLEYQAYKEVTKVLHEKEEIRKEIYTKLPENVKNYVDEVYNDERNVSLDDLVNAFQKYLERHKAEKPLKTKVAINEISIASRKHDIKKILTEKKRISFFELFPIITKEYIVATFLAILEMARNKELTITQNDIFDEIICEVV